MPVMKALSYKQPMAWAFIHGGRDVDSRPSSTNYRGPVLIHASEKWSIDQGSEFWEKFGVHHPHDLRRGGIVGVMDLVDVVKKPCKFQSRWFTGNSWGLVMANARPLPFKPFAGKLGFFDVPFETLYRTSLDVAVAQANKDLAAR